MSTMQLFFLSNCEFGKLISYFATTRFIFEDALVGWRCIYIWNNITLLFTQLFFQILFEKIISIMIYKIFVVAITLLPWSPKRWVCIEVAKQLKHFKRTKSNWLEKIIKSMSTPWLNALLTMKVGRKSNYGS